MRSHFVLGGSLSRSLDGKYRPFQQLAAAISLFAPTRENVLERTQLRCPNAQRQLRAQQSRSYVRETEPNLVAAVWEVLYGRIGTAKFIALAPSERCSNRTVKFRRLFPYLHSYDVFNRRCMY